MPVSVADDAEYQDDTITLDGQEFVVNGPIRAGMASEFSTGLKIGKATYDERLHAFWIVLDDFSGGFGYRKLDIREAGGTHYDNVGGVDLRRPRHITLPTLESTITSDLPPTAIQVGVYKAGSSLFFEPAASGSQLLCGVGNAIYTQNETAGMTRRQLLTDYVGFTRLLDFRGSDGNIFAYAVGKGSGIPPSAVEYFRSSDGITWTQANAIGGQSGETDLRDMIVFDQQLVAETFDNRIISSADGINWSTDVGEDPIYRTRQNRMLSRTFVGIAMAPWGEPAVYFIDNGKLHVLDFYIKTAYPIEDVGNEFSLWTGTVWNGSIWVSDARNIWEYNPGRESTVRYQGPFLGKHGPPPSWNPRGEFDAFPANDDSYYIVSFIPGTSDLFALCRALITDSSSVSTSRLMVYNGTGWSWYGEEVSGFPATANMYGTRLQVFGRKMNYWTHVSNGVGGDITRHVLRLPIMEGQPTVRWNETFAPGPLSFEIGWFDGGFAELEGALLKMSIDGYNISPTETVLVEYRLNNDDSADYITLGTFTDNQQEIWFNLNQQLDHRGVPFKTVQFRITLSRGTNTVLSPEISAFILVYDKVPAVRTAWTVRIDMTRMVSLGMKIDGKDATVERIWQLLKKLHNKPTLLELKVPSLETGGVQVRITDMPSTVEGFREAQGGDGFVELQLIEPVI